jgi:hypothetical protein
MLNVITPPKKLLVKTNKTVFLAGSISGTENWQEELLYHYLIKENLEHITFLNPRRSLVFIDPTKEEFARPQIEWEIEMFDLCDLAFFYFHEGTNAPIALLELGRMIEIIRHGSPKGILVGAHWNYPRLLDIQIQLSLLLQNVRVETDFVKHVRNLLSWTNS